MVVYQALYGERGIWIRPASMWNETAERDGKTYKRLEYIGDYNRYLGKNALARKTVRRARDHHISGDRWGMFMAES